MSTDKLAPTENLKARFGRKKHQLHLIPASATKELSKTFELGASKYGPYNWRVDPVDAATYVSAAKRHLDEWFEGIDADAESGANPLSHTMACCAILIDSISLGLLIDNRAAGNKLYNRWLENKKQHEAKKVVTT